MFPRGFQIGPTQIQPATVLAPMVGVTDTVFRRMIRAQGGCGLIMTEFTSSHGVVQASTNRKLGRNMRYLEFDPEEHPISAQLFGSDPNVMADAARICDRFLLLTNGRLLGAGTLEELQEKAGKNAVNLEEVFLALT